MQFQSFMCKYKLHLISKYLLNCFVLQAGPDPPGPIRYGPKGPRGYPGEPGSRGDHSIRNQFFCSVLTDSVQLYFIC